MTLALVIKIIYNLVLAVVLSFLVGYGINVFYTPPTYPNYGPGCGVANGTDTPVTKDCKPQSYYDAQQQAYESAMHAYSQNVGIISVLFAALFVVVGLFLYYKLPMFSSGVLFAALFTFFYGVINSANANNQKLQFILICVGLVLVLAVGYTLFIHKKGTNTASPSV